MLQRLATLGTGVASSGQAIRQFRNEQESGPELTFAKTFGAVTIGGGGGGIWPNGCPCYVALVFKSWFQTISNILVRCESIGQFWRSTCWYDPWWCLWFAKWFEQRTPWERWDKKGMIPQLDKYPGAGYSTRKEYFGGLQPSGAHNRQRAISMRLCHGVFTY